MLRLLGAPRIALAATFFVFAAGLAEAKFCGDDIDGKRVPCACGDVVRTDTILQPGDPVTTERCDYHGLVVRADPEAESISLNLNGLSIVGQGKGMGLKIERGGTDGAVVVGGYPPRLAEILGFGYGVFVGTPGSLSRMARVAADGNRNGGFVIRQAGAIVEDISADKNGGPGIRILGTGGRFLGLSAEHNHEKGIAINSTGAIVEGSANFNGTHGIVAPAAHTKLVDVEAHGNKASGITVRRPSQHLGTARAVENQKDQFRFSKRDERKEEIR